MARIDRRRIVSLATLLVVVPAAAQSRQDAQRSATASNDDSVPDDIVVTGYRDRAAVADRVRPPSATSTIRNRQSYEYSERLAKCAARMRLTDAARLRAVVDGEFNTATHARAQDLLVRTYISCSETGALAWRTVPPVTGNQLVAGLQGSGGGGKTYGGPNGMVDAAPLGHSIYDRGAFTIQAIKTFAPELTLSQKQVNDPAVQARFNEREVHRNRFRLPIDYRYFETAVCMVRVQPQLAVRLAKGGGGAHFGDIQEALIDRARVCVGGARRVSVDPTQFRLYIADAVYRWAVAALAVDSLIPADGTIAAAS